MSPLSISLALVTIFVGARGKTQKEIRKVLRFDNIGDAEAIERACKDVIRLMDKDTKRKGLTLLNANGMYVQKYFTLLSAYTDILETEFNAVADNVDFVRNGEKVRVKINSYVQSVTNNHIKDLIPPDKIKKDTRLILVNAIYFKGTWLNKFNKAVTRKAMFKISKGNTRTVKMMTQRHEFQYAKSKELKCKIVELPYVGKRLGMYILLPKNTDGLSDLESALNDASLMKLLDSMTSSMVTVSLPRFQIESSFSLADVLQAMGMQTLFRDGAADLSGIARIAPLYVSAVFHKALLEVNEEGSKAAVTTDASEEEFSGALHPLTFRADHPFLVLIRDHCSGLVLFAGRLTQPG